MTNNLENLKNELQKAAGLLPKQEAWAKGICCRCQQTPKFYSTPGRREYNITAMCEFCFDEVCTPEEETCATCNKPFEFHKHKPNRGECNSFVNKPGEETDGEND